MTGSERAPADTNPWDLPKAVLDGLDLVENQIHVKSAEDDVQHPLVLPTVLDAHTLGWPTRRPARGVIAFRITDAKQLDWRLILPEAGVHGASARAALAGIAAEAFREKRKRHPRPTIVRFHHRALTRYATSRFDSATGSTRGTIPGAIKHRQQALLEGLVNRFQPARQAAARAGLRHLQRITVLDAGTIADFVSATERGERIRAWCARLPAARQLAFTGRIPEQQWWHRDGLANRIAAGEPDTSLLGELAERIARSVDTVGLDISGRATSGKRLRRAFRITAAEAGRIHGLLDLARQLNRTPQRAPDPHRASRHALALPIVLNLSDATDDNEPDGTVRTLDRLIAQRGPGLPRKDTRKMRVQLISEATERLQQRMEKLAFGEHETTDIPIKVIDGITLRQLTGRGAGKTEPRPHEAATTATLRLVRIIREGDDLTRALYRAFALGEDPALLDNEAGIQALGSHEDRAAALARANRNNPIWNPHGRIRVRTWIDAVETWASTGGARVADAVNLAAQPERERNWLSPEIPVDHPLVEDTGITFEALVTRDQLAAESRAMSHCLGGMQYAFTAPAGNLHAWHLKSVGASDTPDHRARSRQPDPHHSTLALTEDPDGRWQLREHQGGYNREVDASHRAGARKLVAWLNGAHGEEPVPYDARAARLRRQQVSAARGHDPTRWSKAQRLAARQAFCTLYPGLLSAPATRAQAAAAAAADPPGEPLEQAA